MSFHLGEYEEEPSEKTFTEAYESIQAHGKAIERVTEELNRRKLEGVVALCFAFILGVITYQYVKR